MSAARAIKDFARIAAAAGLSKKVVSFPDKKLSLPAERVMTTRELGVIYDRLRHTLDLIPLSTCDSQPKLRRMRQSILKHMEVLASMTLEAAGKDEKPPLMGSTDSGRSHTRDNRLTL